MDNNVSKQRNSSIEAFKIFAIVLIVISHVVQTLESNGNGFISFSGYGISLSEATTDNQQLTVALLRYSGILGNTIFFVCSAWFLLDSTIVRKQKILHMFADMWTVSVVILLIVLALKKGKLNGSLILRSLLPATMENNWYVNCYILFYAIHPMLNRLIHSLSKRTMLRVTLSMITLYLILSFITLLTRNIMRIGSVFFSSKLIVWIVIYFIIAYFKLYANKAAESIPANIVLVTVGFIGFYGLVILTNTIGLKMELFRNILQIWNVAYNPFLIALVICLFLLIRRIRFCSNTVNYISKLSLFIYIIHENILLRTLYRPMLWNYVHENYGYTHILYWAVVIAAMVFVFGFIASVLYKETLHRLVALLCDKSYPRLKSKWISFEDKLENRLH